MENNKTNKVPELEVKTGGSVLKRNVYADPIPEFLKKSPLVFVVRWNIPKEKHDKLIEDIVSKEGTGLDTQRLHPENGAYTLTRHWYRPNSDGKTEEWWFMDEYDSAEAFEAAQKRVLEYNFSKKSEENNKQHQEFLDLFVPNTTIEPILYSEILPCRVEFEPYKYRAEAWKRMEKVAHLNSNSKM